MALHPSLHPTARRHLAELHPWRCKVPRKKPTKAWTDKPHHEFPVFQHATGQWAKSIRGTLHDFGTESAAALAKYLDDRDDLQAVRTPRGVAMGRRSRVRRIPGLAVWRYNDESREHFYRLIDPEASILDAGPGSLVIFTNSMLRTIRVVGSFRTLPPITGPTAGGWSPRFATTGRELIAAAEWGELVDWSPRPPWWKVAASPAA